MTESYRAVIVKKEVQRWEEAYNILRGHTNYRFEYHPEWFENFDAYHGLCNKCFEFLCDLNGRPPAPSAGTWKSLALGWVYLQNPDWNPSMTRGYVHYFEYRDPYHG